MVAGIEVLSIVGRGVQTDLATIFTLGAAAECRLVAD
jgi:hypothetical protein